VSAPERLRKPGAVLVEADDYDLAVAAAPGSFMGIPIKTDWRIPGGVYVIVPHGCDLAHPGTQIGAISPEYQDAARSLASSWSGRYQQEGGE
jgi:hypothetical protein